MEAGTSAKWKHGTTNSAQANRCQWHSFFLPRVWLWSYRFVCPRISRLSPYTALTAAANAPQRWHRVVAMSVPPVLILRKALDRNLAQIKRSWYMFYFQSALAETAIPANDFALIEMLWEDWSPGFKSKDDLDNFKKCVSSPGHLKAALGYYRASLGNGKKTETYNDIETKGLEPLKQPTLFCMAKMMAALASNWLKKREALALGLRSGFWIRSDTSCNLKIRSW